MDSEIIPALEGIKVAIEGFQMIFAACCVTTWVISAVLMVVFMPDPE